MFVTAQLDPCSADYVQGVRMSFRTKEDAVHFAEKQGWDYYVYVILSLQLFSHAEFMNRQPPMVKRIPPKNYAENFLYRPTTLRWQQTK